MTLLTARARLLGLAVCVPLALALAAPLAQASPRHYTLDPATSKLTIHVGKTGVLGFVGHEHEVVAGAFRGDATFDPDRIARSTVDVTFDAGALRVSGKGEPAGDVPEVQAAMVGAACLDAHRFPTIHFLSNIVTAAGEVGPGGGDLTIHGNLTLHDVTRPLTLRVHVDVKGDTLEGTGSIRIRQTDFKITPISKAGVVKVEDELALSWRIRGKAS
jgi:polyisoprenoid-binding protein YceI